MGESDFVEQILEMSEGNLRREYKLKQSGYNLKKLKEQVARIYNIDRKAIYAKGRKRIRVESQSLYCYWAARELKVPLVELAKKFGLSMAGISYYVQKGEEIAEENCFQLLD